MDRLKGLKCRECGRYYPSAPVHVCEFCFGPLEVDYDYEAIRARVSRARDRGRARRASGATRDLLPMRRRAARRAQRSGFTPLVRARNLARRAGRQGALGQERLGLPPDLVLQGPRGGRGPRQGQGVRLRHRGLRLDRQPRQLGGGPRRRGAAQVLHLHPGRPRAGQGHRHARLRRRRWSRSQGTYDEVNRLCSEVADKYRWAFVNINIRPVLRRGLQDLRLRDRRAARLAGARPTSSCPAPAARSSPRSGRPSRSCAMLGLIAEGKTQMYAAQARGLRAHRDHDQEGHGRARARAAATPSPSRWPSATRPTATTPTASAKDSGGCGEHATDEEIVEGMQLLARTEGIFTETAGGVTVAATKKLIEQGGIPRDESDRHLHHGQRAQDARTCSTTASRAT